jgi:hypothetical protein
LLEVVDDPQPLLKLGILRLDGVLEMHDHMGARADLLTCEVNLLSGVVQLVLGLAKVAVCDLQLKVLLRRLTCPTIEESILMLKPLHCMQREGGLLDVCIQTCTLLGDDSTGVVLQVEQVPHVFGQVRALEAELWAGDVTHDLVALLPHGLHMITYREECKQCVDGDGEAMLTKCSESHMRHLLDGVINVVADDGSPE